MQRGMIIHFQRSGGFTGMLVQATINSASLSPAEADKLHNLVQDANFFELPAQLTSTSSGADQFQYIVSVEDGTRRHTVETSDGAAPPSLRPLLRELTLLARAR
jgi:hypothetical protein